MENLFKFELKLTAFFADIKLLNSIFNLLLALWNEKNLIRTGRLWTWFAFIMNFYKS
jgi:hypothetical protein